MHFEFKEHFYESLSVSPNVSKTRYARSGVQDGLATVNQPKSQV